MQGCFIGPGNTLGTPIPIENAIDHMFGLVLVNDWSARDIQKWEYVPLGPFNAKNWATSISPWVVTLEALEPFKAPAPPQDPTPLPYLTPPNANTECCNYDIRLEASILPEGHAGPAAVLSRSNMMTLYWTVPQMISHHTAGGCNLRPGDLVATGTLSIQGEGGQGCLLELTSAGAHPVELEGGAGRRTYLEDGDTVTLGGYCQGEGYRVGFGECKGKILPPLPLPR